LDFATPVIEQNVIESLEAAVLTKSSSQPKSTYATAESLSEFELTKILMDKMEEHKSYLIADYKKELYDALVKSYNTKKDLFDTYCEEAESSRDLKSKESKSSSSSKGTSRSHHNSFGKSAHAEEPSHTVYDLGVRQNQEFDMGNNDEQPNDKATPRVNWFKKPERPLTPNPDWDKRQHEILVGPAFNLLKVTCKSRTELEYYFEECYKATTEQLDWHNPKGKQYSFDLRKPFLLILDDQGRQVIPQDYFINNNLEYLKGGSLSRQYLTSVTKTKAATYEVNWIEDIVPNI
nr:hypothetical protein [Tanacetum cinerariifolium]